MEKEKAIKKIVENFEDLLKKNKIFSKPQTEAIWFHQTEHAGSCEVDEEWLGVNRDGKIVWAYTSGCSCWEGGFDEEVCETISMKEFEFKHDDMKKEWESKLIEFANAI